VKINVASIIVDHWRTLYDARSGRTSWSDVFIFYILPIALAVAAYSRGLSVTGDSYNVSITFFGIFVALLLNIQVAMFSIFQRKWTPPPDVRKAKALVDENNTRRKLLGELNSNISYLMLISCIGLTFLLGFHIFQKTAGFAPAFTLGLYTHFILTFVMIVKRAHALFQKEYAEDL